MSEPAKPTDSAPKPAEDFMTKYKVRLASGDRIRLTVEGVENLLLTLLLNRLGPPVSSLCFDRLRGV